MIKVGEYVRTKTGEIARVISMFKKDILEDEEGASYYTDEVVKHSKNIIDLVETGDIVFIQDVLNNDFIYIYDNEMLKAVREDIEGGLQITQVLTREQFEANAYKIDIN